MWPRNEPINAVDLQLLVTCTMPCGTYQALRPGWELVQGTLETGIRLQAGESAVASKLWIAAAQQPARSEQANRQLPRPRVIGWITFSTRLLSIGRVPLSP